MKPLTGTIIKSLIFIAVTVIITAVLAGTIRNGTIGDTYTYRALFTDATSVNKGDDVRVAGVKAGNVESVEVVDKRLARITFNLDRNVRLKPGAHVSIFFRNLVGQRYVSVEQGDGNGPAIRPGHTFSLDETSPALDFTMLFNGFQPLFRLLSPEDTNRLSQQIIQVFQGQGVAMEELVSSTASLTNTVAKKDEVIGVLIDSLNSVLTTVNDRTDQLDTTLITLQRLVSGLSADRRTIGSAIENLGGLTTSVSDLLEESRAPLKSSIDALGDLSANLADAEKTLDEFFANLPLKVDKIGRLASYGSWINAFLCSVDPTGIPNPEGYMGGIGANPVAARCQG